MSTVKLETKEAPKTDPSPFAAFDPYAMWTASQQAFAKMMADGYGRAQAYADQYAALESQMIARAQAAVASWAQLTQDAIAYGGQLSAEARKLSLDTFKKMGFAA
jgi:hypothetical protein